MKITTTTARTPWRTPHKYGVGKPEDRTADGHRFDSRMERDYYLHLALQVKAGTVLHVDVHPIATLGPGDRVQADFLVWHADGRVEFQDVKSTIAHRLTEFRRLQKRWRHPGAPLVGMLWDRRYKLWTRLEAEADGGS